MRVETIGDATLYLGDCISVLRSLPDCSVQTCVTSPPYWGLRDYGVDGQLGLERTPDEYTAKMVEVFREVRRVLRDDGTLWLNLGDSYASNAATTKNPAKVPGSFESYRGSDTPTINTDKQGRIAYRGNGIKAKDLIGIPWRVAFVLQADGWYLRSDIIWHKPNPMPESVTDRPTKAHEYIFLMSKSERYYYDAKAIAEPVTASSLARIGQATFDTQEGGEKDYAKTGVNTNRSMRRTLENFKKKQDQLGKQTYTGFNDRYKDSPVSVRNKRTVWTVPTKPCSEAHFATFNPDLITPCILAGAPTDGVVLDPFLGAGTTALTAHNHGRACVGIELNPEYFDICVRRINAATAQGNLFAPKKDKPKQETLL